MFFNFQEVNLTEHLWNEVRVLKGLYSAVKTQSADIAIVAQSAQRVERKRKEEK